MIEGFQRLKVRKYVWWRTSQLPVRAKPKMTEAYPDAVHCTLVEI